MHDETEVPIWFFIGCLLLIYGVLIFGAGNVFGHLMASPATVGHLRARDGLMLAVALEFACSAAACAALFTLGRLLRLI